MKRDDESCIFDEETAASIFIIHLCSSKVSLFTIFRADHDYGEEAGQRTAGGALLRGTE